jgi:hypothetical protein
LKGRPFNTFYMKVEFLKDHLKYKKDTTAEVDDPRGNYFIRTGVAKEAKRTKKEAVEVKEETPKEEAPKKRGRKKRG